MTLKTELMTLAALATLGIGAVSANAGVVISENKEQLSINAEEKIEPYADYYDIWNPGTTVYVAAYAGQGGWAVDNVDIFIEYHYHRELTKWTEKLVPVEGYGVPGHSDWTLYEAIIPETGNGQKWTHCNVARFQNGTTDPASANPYNITDDIGNWETNNNLMLLSWGWGEGETDVKWNQVAHENRLNVWCGQQTIFKAEGEGVCDPNGNTDQSKLREAWNEAEANYESAHFGNDVKAYFSNFDALTTQANGFENHVARYDYIRGRKYSQIGLSDWAKRGY